MLKTQVLQIIEIPASEQPRLMSLDLAVWISSKNNSINQATLYINLLVEDKKIRIKADKTTLSNIKVSLLNNHFELSDYRKISAISLELESTNEDIKIDSIHMQTELRKGRAMKKVAA